VAETNGTFGTFRRFKFLLSQFGGKINIKHWRLEHQDLRRNHLEQAIRSFESSIRVDPKDLDVLHILRDIRKAQRSRSPSDTSRTK